KDAAKPAKPARAVSPVNGLCFTCHEEEAYATHPVARHPTSGKDDVNRPGKELSCVSCHDPHQSKHKRLFYKSDSTMAMCVECHGKGKKPIR
ncbi:MAG: cytochrome c3 family protein, partial [Acidobacteriota bacterium]|nr:cytochrome c3 family protein [Acidobacteriota bacterium]